MNTKEQVIAALGAVSQKVNSAIGMAPVFTELQEHLIELGLSIDELIIDVEDAAPWTG